MTWVEWCQMISNDLQSDIFLFKDGYRGKCRQGCLNQVREFMSRMVKRKMFFWAHLGVKCTKIPFGCASGVWTRINSMGRCSARVIFFAFFIVFVINLQISFAPDHTGHFERGKFIDHVRKLDLGTLLDHVHVEARVFADRRHFVHWIVIDIMNVHLKKSWLKIQPELP